ncbi:uncharacterized protein LOC108664305 [Hyalella azteca]|uniref:Uncharacterized protein LOC108664305 n=1 Tax=Hyalella azteca TaxID=294128 RepID=A0A8B7MXT9_HYAAZ|nr:uncharacterized protein LOC108664305 [Hyalella azteca]
MIGREKMQRGGSIFVTALLVSCWALTVRALIETKSFIKVPNATKIPLDACFIDSPTVIIGNLVALCGSMCINNDQCEFFCTDETTNRCFLSRAVVSARYTEATTATVAIDACYSTLKIRDVIRQSANVTASPSYDSTTAVAKALDGYYCPDGSTAWEVYLSSQGDNPYYQIDFLEPIRVIETRIAFIYPGWASNVQIFLGNYSVFSQNPTFAYRPGIPSTNYFIESFLPSEPMVGRYLTVIAEVSSWFLGIGEIYVLV